MRYTIAIGLLIGLAVLVWLGVDLLPEIGGDTEPERREWLLAVSAATCGFLATSLLIGGRGGRQTQTLRAFLAGVGFAAVAATTYTYRIEILAAVHRATVDYAQQTGASVPRAHGADEPDGVSVRIRRRADGHFLAEVDAGGRTLPMLVDTGASTVVLKLADAQRLGVDTERLRYTVPVQTANGTAYAAAVRLRSLTVGGITIPNVEALVSRPGTLRDSLLGMTFLSRLRSYEFSGEFLTLRI